MTIDRFLKKGSVRPQDAAMLDEAFRLALRKLNLVDRGDPITEMVARQVIQAARAGAQTAADVVKIAIKNLGIRMEK